MSNNRQHYLIAYDICNDKRLAKTHKIIEAFAVNGQKSFYDCWLTKHELYQLKDRLTELIDEIEDRVYFFQLHQYSEQLYFGKAKDVITEPFLIV